MSGTRSLALPDMEDRLQDYLASWVENLKERPEWTIPSALDVTKEVDRHWGPRMDRVSVELMVEPSNRFEVIDEVRSDEGLRALRYPDYFVYGMLDILMTSGPMPLTKVRIVLKVANYDRIDSSPQTFLLAGRDAGQKIRAFTSKR